MSRLIQAPPSKSASHRAAIAAALTPGMSRLDNLLTSDDIARTLTCLSTLGATLDWHGGSLRITGMRTASEPASEQASLDLNVGESGTTCRLIAPIAALRQGSCLIHGEGRMHERPIGELTTALAELGVTIHWQGTEGYPPFVLTSRGLTGGAVDVSLEESSQFLSGLLLAAPMASGETLLGIGGSKAVSWPYAALTLQTMQEFGVQVRAEERCGQGWQTTDWAELTDIRPGQVRFRVSPQQYQPREAFIEGDWSNASYFLAAGLLLPGGVTVGGLKHDSVQGDRSIIDFLNRMGAAPAWESQGLHTSPGMLHGADLDMGRCPDLVPTMAVLASLVQGPTRIRNVAHLRLKESDRLEALASQIAKTGCSIRTTPDGLDIQPAAITPGQRIDFSVYGDHRLAMSLALYELVGLDVQLDDPKCVAKSFPGFWEAWASLGPENL